MAERTLLAVLDWGLGHASRCVPLIRQLQEAGDEVWVASAGSALKLLAQECPQVPRFNLPAYAVRYPTASMAINLLLQGPRLLSVMLRERRCARRLVRELQPSRIISDGRFAFYDPRVQSIWLAHQLQIQYQHPHWQALLNHLYHIHIRRQFQAVWVPDWEAAERSLAGKLATPIADVAHHYLGPLSRYRASTTELPITYDWLCLLSGPEPQRSRLEAEVRQQFRGTPARMLLVRGCPGREQIHEEHPNFYVVDWLHGNSLAEAVATSARILCRAGYSSLMDLHYWQKPAVLIPTPGQTEQEYLARYWAERGWAENKNTVSGNL